MHKITFVLTVVFLMIKIQLNAQYGVTDPDFNPEDQGNIGGIGALFTDAFGASGTVLDIEKQADEKILAAGTFLEFNHLQMNSICRLDVNGLLDTTFQSVVENTYFPQSRINRVIELPNGQLLIAGAFNIGSCIHIARLNSDGSLDPSFNNDTIFNGEILNMEVLPDGRIVVSGSFSECYGQVRNGIAILNPDGSLDNSFVPATDPGSVVRALCLMQDGKILVGKSGSFVMIQKLLLTGEIDSTFQPFGTVNGGFICSLKELSNGKILASGQIGINPYNTDGINGLMRFNGDGSWDTDFHSYYSVSGQTRTIYDFLVLNNGSIIIAGCDNQNNVHLFRLDSLGNEENSLINESMYLNGYSLSAISDSTFLVGGNFNMDNNAYRNGLMKFTTEGEFIPDFMTFPGANKGIQHIEKLPNGQLMIGGEFNIYNGHIARKLARINSDGSIDTSFHSPLNSYLEVGSFAVQSTGKVILKYGSILRRYNADGSLDPSFNVTISNTNAQFKVVVDSSDNIYYSSVSAINKLNPDGSVDGSFSTAVDVTGNTDFIVLQTGKLIILGGVNFSTPTIICLNADGTLDNTFQLDPDLQFSNGGISYLDFGFKVRENPDGKLMVSGHAFNHPSIVYPSGLTNQIFRLNPNGSFDVGFKPKAPVIANLGSLSDGTIIVVTRIDADLYPKIAWIKSNGDVDYRFIPKEFSYSNYGLSAVILQDDRCIIGGYMERFGNDYRNNILAIKNCYGPVKYDHITAYDQYTWEDGVNYTQSTIGQQYSFSIPNACDSLLILDLNIIHPEINTFTTPAYDSNCDGVAYVTMTGIGPFYFSFQGSTVNTNSSHTYTGLCPGIYDITVTDALGITYNSTFVIAQDSNYYFDDPFAPGTAIEDSISVVVENCDVDFNTVYDVYIDSYLLVGQDSILVTWAVVDSFNINIINALYYFPDTLANYYIQLELFCPEKSTPHFLVATQGVCYTNGHLSTLGISEESINLSIYPNPTNDRIHINFSGSDAELIVYDLQGKVVLKDRIQNQEIISLQNFERGVYLFDFKNSNGQSVQRVVKQ
jgi:uncharacterized delta-60 repeat protein